MFLVFRILILYASAILRALSWLHSGRTKVRHLTGLCLNPNSDQFMWFLRLMTVNVRHYA